VNRFAYALSAFLGSSFRIFFDPELRAWYFRVVKRCLLVAALTITVLLVGGAWIISRLGPGVWPDVGAVVWVIAVLFLSGKITVSIMGLLAANFVEEARLLSALSGVKIVKLREPTWTDRRREWWAAGRGIGISLLVWPLFLFPVTAPIGIVIFAWSMGREAMATAIRVWHQNGDGALGDEKGSRPSNMLAFGLGLIPAFASILPIVGWTVWPFLLAAAVTALRAPKPSAPGPGPSVVPHP